MKKLKYEPPTSISLDRVGDVPFSESDDFITFDKTSNDPGACMMGGVVGFGCMMGGIFSIPQKQYEFTGRMIAPASTDVRQGVEYDDSENPLVGVLDIPAVEDVRSGTQFDNTSKEGTLDLPAVGNVRDGVTFDGATKEGVLDLPPIADVREGVAFDNNTKIGTLDVPIVPSEDDVREGVEYGDGESHVGNLELPVEADVEKGVQYGANGTEFTGTFIPAYTGGKIEVDIQNMNYEVQVEVKRKRPT